MPWKSYYVDPVSGDDGNEGSLAAPFRTIDRARVAVRAINRSMTGDITVFLRERIHRLDRTLIFDTDDSGNNGHPAT